MSDRQGHTLVELIIVMSVGATLAVSAIGTVHRTMRVQSTARKQEAILRTAARLSRSFRHDVHAARSAKIQERVPGGDESENADFTERDAGNAAGGSKFGSLGLSGKWTTRYTSGNGTVFREQQRTNGQVHREQFQFGPGARVTFGRLTEPSRAVLSVAERSPETGVPTREVLHVEAVIGRRVLLERPGSVDEDRPPASASRSFRPAVGSLLFSDKSMRGQVVQRSALPGLNVLSIYELVH